MIWYDLSRKLKHTDGLNLIIQHWSKARIDYYIFGFNISGCDLPTENVITRNVIHELKGVLTSGHFRIREALGGKVSVPG